MQWLAEICVRRPVFASVLMLIVLVIGLFGYKKLGVDEFPNVDIPIVIVTTELPGAAPKEVESDVTDKIEGAVNTISGIDELRSSSSEGISQVVVSFDLDKDLDTAAQDVRDKVNLVLRDLPAGVEQPVVSKVDPDSSPILLVAVRSKASLRETTEIADKKIRRQIESIAGVGQVTLVGGRARQVNVWLDPLRLKAHDLTALDVQRAIYSENQTSPGGNIETGPENLSVRVAGKVTSPEQIGRIIVGNRNSHPLRVEDVARVEDGEAEVTSVAQLNGEPTVVLAVRKQSGTNTVAVVDTVRARLDEISKSLPPGISLEVVRDNSGVIRTGIHAVTEHLIVGAFLAAAVVLLFLGNGRSTIIAAVSIPISIIGTFGLMWLQGYTLNFLTLLALALAVGIVIDDAIVVLENIVRFVDEKGIKPFPAAVLATREIGLAVLATTLSLMAVFIPVAFMAGMAGRFLASFGITMAFAIAVSLIVSFTLTPMLAARWLVPRDPSAAPSRLSRWVDAFYGPIERAYMKLLGGAMRRRWVVVLAAAVVLGSCAPLAKSLPSGFLPQNDKGQFEISVRAPEGTSVAETKLVAERVAQDARKLPGVERTLLMVAEDAKHTANLAKVYVFLVDPKTRDITQFELMDRVRKEIFPKQSKELRLNVGEVQAINTGSSSANITYALSGPDLDRLSDFATRITEQLRKTPGAVDVDNTLVIGKPEVRVVVDRERAADLGVKVADIAAALRLTVAGAKVSSYAEGGEEYEVRMRTEPQFRERADQLSVLSVPSSKLGSVPLGSVVKFEPGQGPSEINRLGRRRQITISANAAPGVGDSQVEGALQEITEAVSLPPGYELQAVGRSKEAAKLVGGFLMVIALAFIFMYLVLAAQFESWLHPVTILIALPLTVPFALVSLHIFGQSLNLFSGLGLLVLFGVVKKNAILQIDHTNHLRRQGRPRLEAILEANRDRLRPILMTTAAFVAGMVPLILSRGIGSGLNRATAGIVLGGQTLSLLLTLIATPVAYSFFDDMGAWFKRRFGRKEAVDRGEAELQASHADVGATPQAAE